SDFGCIGSSCSGRHSQHPISDRDDFHIATSVRRCEELARQAKPPAPPSLQTLGRQGRWGRRFRLPGRPEANFSQLLSAGTVLDCKPVPALTLGAIRPPPNTATNMIRGKAALCSNLKRLTRRVLPPQKLPYSAVAG